MRVPATSLKRAAVPALRKSAPGRFQPLPNKSSGQALERRIWLLEPRHSPSPGISPSKCSRRKKDGLRRHALSFLLKFKAILASIAYLSSVSSYIFNSISIDSPCDCRDDCTLKNKPHTAVGKRDLVACGVALPLLALALWRDHGQTPWVKNGWAGLPGRVHRGIPNPRHLASVLNQPQGFGSWHARPRRIIRTRQSGQRLSSSTVGRHPFLARYKEKPT